MNKQAFNWQKRS